jgi:hypothetical protein
MNYLIQPYARLKEFVLNYTTGKPYTGDCMQDALTVSINAAQGMGTKPQDLSFITGDMIRRGLAAPTGATTVVNIVNYVESRPEWGQKAIAYVKAYTGDTWDENEWHAQLLRYAGIQPLMIQVANGQALGDAVTHVMEQPGLKYHGIAIAGRNATGYLACDGNHAEDDTRYQVYTMDALRAAQPCGMVVFNWLRPSSVYQLTTADGSYPND